MPAQLWYIYLVKNPRYTQGRRGQKYVVIVLIDTSPMRFYINSEITDWITARPGLWACEANISAEEHPVLTHDSYVDCQEVYRFQPRELTARKDKISANAKRAIVNAVRDCPKLERKYKEAILVQQDII